MPFYTYNKIENWDVTRKFVIIEADDLRCATHILITKAKSVGYTTDGVGTSQHMIYDVVFDKLKTEDDIVKDYFEDISEFILDYNYYNCDIYYLDNTVKEFRFNQKHIDKATKLKNSHKKFVWGFEYNPNWNQPSKIYKAYLSDYNDNLYYDRSGNYDLIVKPGKHFVRNNSGHVSVSFGTKAEVEPAYNSFNEVMDQINKSALEIINNNKDKVDPTLYKALIKRFSQQKQTS